MHLFGWTRETALEKNFFETVFPTQYQASLKNRFRRIVVTKDDGLLNTWPETTALDSQNRPFPVELAFSPITTEEGVLCGAFLRDISGRKQTDDALQHARKDAEFAHQSKSEFLANMSHELRTPLHSILSFAGFGLKKAQKAPPERILGYFQKIDTSGRSLLSLLDNLLDLAKLESGKMTFDFQSTDLNRMLGTAIEEFQALRAEHGCTI